jgi:hypothetical protein
VSGQVGKVAEWLSSEQMRQHRITAGSSRKPLCRHGAQCPDRSPLKRCVNSLMICDSSPGNGRFHQLFSWNGTSRSEEDAIDFRWISIEHVGVEIAADRRLGNRP